MIVIQRNILHPFHPIRLSQHATFTRACEAMWCEKESNSGKTVTNRNESDETQPERKKATAVPTTFTKNSYLIENDNEFILTVDLPGVQPNDVSITDENYRLTIRAERKKGDHVVAKYVRTFALDNKTTDHTNIKAFLDNGVLSIKIPKAPKVDPAVLVPKTGDVPESTNDTTKVFHVTLDLPGVKLNDLKVTLTPDQDVDIQAHRKRGGSTARIRHALSITQHTIDTRKAELFLNDGVMTLVAPMAEDMSRYPARDVLVDSSQDAMKKNVGDEEAEETCTDEVL